MKIAFLLKLFFPLYVMWKAKDELSELSLQ